MARWLLRSDARLDSEGSVETDGQPWQWRWSIGGDCGMVALVVDGDGNEKMMAHRIAAAGKYFRCGDAAWFCRAVTYGPFPPDGGLRCGAELARDLDTLVEIGANTLRVYGVPGDDFVAACRQRGLRVLITPAWTQHVDFFENASALSEAHDQLVAVAERFRGETAVMGYLVGNEIPPTLVRWMGPRRVREALEKLIAAGRAKDPSALFSYASYPSTEYLMPGNADFAAYNVFLEDEPAYFRYLLRLQNVAGDRPLMITEFGIDSQAGGEEKQAAAMAWQVDAVCRAGAAGTTVFAFSDCWHRAGKEVTGWDFGLQRRDGSAKPAARVLANAWREVSAPIDGVTLSSSPSMSVIVCTYRGAPVLGECLRSLDRLRYPDVEILVVNDGADVAVEKIVAGFPGVRHIPQKHSGLSAARNLGAAQARGEVLVYTDDDCRVDRDWLSYLALALESGEFSAVGGPNVAPTADTLAGACVTAAPGGPAHVLLSDTVAEHLPGCNLAVRREAFESVGGFGEEFRTAGDDVDFCWRLQTAGFRIGFHPAAWVWHLRRGTVRAYLRQQLGYGKAEAMLIPKHGDRFGAIGAARWRGWVYDGAFATEVSGASLIYQGVFGYAGFQAVYGGDRGLAYIVSSVQWLIVALIFVLVGFVLLPMGLLGGLMFAVSAGAAVRVGWRALLPAEYDTLKARLIVSVLAWLQPLLRGAVRMWGSMPYARLPRGLPPLSRPVLFPRRWAWSGIRRGLCFWSSEGLTRDHLLGALQGDIAFTGQAVSAGDGWQDWDLEYLASPLWSVQVTTVTEYHAADDRLTRVRLEARPTLLTIAWKVLGLVVFVFAWQSAQIFAAWQLWTLFAAAFFFPGAVRLVRLARVRRHCLRIARELGFRVAE